MKKKVLIIGSGLGGLSTGVFLAKEGYDVTVLEQSFQIGGCLQCFHRKGVKFETGMHFVGSISEGEILDKLLKVLEIRDAIEFSPLDPNGYDVISFCGKTYKIPSGRKALVEQLSQSFPEQHDNLETYVSLVEEVASSSALHTMDSGAKRSLSYVTYQTEAMDEVINRIIPHPLLANILSGSIPLYAAEKGKTPFSTHAFIMDFYNKSASRIVGGSNVLADSLQRVLEKYGGRILTKKKVVAMDCDNTQILSVRCDDASVYTADIYISAIHPLRTLEQLGNTSMLRPAYKRRIQEARQTIGCFTVYLHFKKDRLPYMNHNFYAYNQDTPWDCEHYTSETWPKGFLYMHFCHESSPRYAQTGIIISYMQMEDVVQWRGARVGHRGEAYEAFKREHAEKLLESLDQHLPGTKACVEVYYTSTPLTYEDYTGTEQGGMYGIAKDINAAMGGRVSHKTKIPNLLFAGQNVNSHGILGTLVGSLVTCGEIVGSDKLEQDLNLNNNTNGK